MIKIFENKYGKHNKTILVVGDNNMKGKKPTICKRFKNAYYKTYFVIVVMKK